MNILFISELSNLGGGETSLLNSLIEFSKPEYNINSWLMCFEEGQLAQEARENGIKVIIYDLKNELKCKRLKNVFKYIYEVIKSNSIEAIQTNDWWSAVAVSFISKFYFFRCKSIWMCHGQWYRFSFIKRNMINLFINNIIAVSKNVEENLRSNRIKSIKIKQIYLGIDIKKFETGDRNKIRREFEIEDNTKLFAVIGRFQKIKGQDLVVKTIKKLHNIEYNYKCLLVGDSIFNSKNDDEYKKKILDYIKENNLEDKIIITGVRNDIPDILKGIDALILPSINESLGMVVLEAFAAGCLVISTPCDGTKETIINGKTGVLLEDRNVNELEKALLTVLNNEINVEEIKANEGKEVKRYSIKEICTKYLEVYKNNK